MTCAIPGVVLLTAGQNQYRLFWNLFGTSNQLLAGLSLLVISVWLRRQGRRAWFASIPMFFVLSVTVVSLVIQIRQLASATALTAPWFNGLVALVLLALAGFMMAIALKAFFRPGRHATASVGAA